MRIIPVLDLKEGLVVHAIKGERERYQPVRSILTSRADPLEVARCLQTETQCRTFYIADLNAIQGKGHNREAIGEIASQLNAELWVDAGVVDAQSHARLVAEVDGVEHPPDGEHVANVHERQVTGGQRHIQTRRREHHHRALGPGAMGEQFGVAGPFVARLHPRFLADGAVGRRPSFWKLAQALSALYPMGTDEKRWVDGVLSRKKGAGFG